MVNFITKSLKNKLVVLFLIVSIIPISIIGYMSYKITKAILESQTLASLEAVANSRVSDINHLMQLRQEQAKEFAGIFSARQLESSGLNDTEDIAKIQAHIESVFQEMKLRPKRRYVNLDKSTAIDIISICDTKGTIVANTNKELIGNKMPDHYLQKVKTYGTFIGGFNTDVLTGKNFLIFLQAIRDFEDDKFAGVVSFKTNAQILNEITTDRTGLGDTGEVYIVNKDYFMITESRFVDDAILKQKVNTPIVKKCFAGEETLGVYPDYRGVPIVGSTKLMKDQEWCLLAEIDAAEAFAPALQLGLIILLGSIIVALIIAFVAYFIAMGITKPIKKLSSLSKKVAEGDLDVQMDINKSKDEIDVLALSFNMMTSKLRELYVGMEHKVAERTSNLEKTNIELKIKREIEKAYNDIVTILNSYKQMDELLSRSLSKIVSFSDSQVGIIYLYDEKEECLTMASCYAVGDHNIKQEKFKLGMGIPGQTAQERNRILIKDIPDDTAFRIKSGYGEFIPKTIGSFPIICQGKLFGVLTLASLKECSDDVLEFIEGVLVQLAVSISNTISFELVKDQSERLKKQESELVEREKRITAILENTVDAIITINENGIIETFNQAAERIFGYTASEAIGNNIKMLQPEPYASHHDEYLSNYINTGEAKVLGIGREVEGLRKDGTTFPLDLAISEVMIGERRIFSGIVRDITESKKAEEDIKNANKELQLQNEELKNQADELMRQKIKLKEKNQEVERSNQVKSEFLANMSHELRTPLNSIIGFSEMMIDQTFGELNTKQQKHAKNINMSGLHLLQLINDILDLSKVEAGKIELHYEDFLISEVMQEVESVIKIQMEEKGISFEAVVGNDMGLIKADKKIFKQIMQNLLSNAVKFTPKGGKIIVNVTITEIFVKISVTDTGIGIKPEDQKRIFAEFEQIDSSSSRKYEGTGLGLPLTRKFVELHGGEILVESEFGKGSTFTFTIPLNLERENLIQELSSLDRIEGKSDKSLILVVEDDPQCAELLNDYLVKEGYKVAITFDGNEAIKKAKELQPMAITLDILLPEKKGWETLSELKQMSETKNIPIIIISVIDEKERGFNLGAIDYLVKPINKEELLRTVERCRFSSKVDKKTINILVVDDEPKTVELVSLSLEAEGYRIQKAYGGKDGIDLACKQDYDLIILDLMMPEVDGFDVVDKLQKQQRKKDVPIMIFTSKDLTKDDLEILHGKVLSISQKGKFSKEKLLSDIKKVDKVKKMESKGD